MSESRLLTPQEAEGVVDKLIDQFGLGALPPVRVVATADGMWHVQWDRSQRTVAPMNMEAWQAWLGQNVGSLDASDLGTTES